MADVNNDGALDVLAASPDDDTVAWFESNNRLAPNFLPEFQKVVIDESAAGASSLFAIDLDGDGDVDVVAASHDDNTVAWYESNCISGESPPATPVSTLVPTHAPSVEPVSTPVSTYAPSTKPMSTSATPWQPSESLPTSVSPPPPPYRPSTKKAT